MSGQQWGRVSIQRVWAVVRADLRQLLRQRTALVLALVMVVSGIGLAVVSTRIDPALVIPMPGKEATESDATESPELCVGGPKVSVEGLLPTYLQVPGEVVADGDPDAVVGMQWLPGESDDGELLYWQGPAGTEADVDRFVDCVRLDIIDEWNRRHAALGITHRRYEVLKVKRHGPISRDASAWAPQMRWLEPELPSGLDFFEVMAAAFALLLASGQVVDSVLRNRVTGWEETLGIVGLSGPERVVARMLSAGLLSVASVALFTVGGLLAAPVVGLVVDPLRVLVSLLTPISVGVVLVTVSRSADDVRSATAQVVFPFALLLYAVLGAVSLDVVWLPVGGPLVLAVLGGTPLEWFLGVAGTVVPTVLVGAFAVWGVPDVRTNHGERRSAAARHARGRFGPEALLLCALAFWSMVILPLVAGESVVAAHLTGQVLGLGGVALVAPLALGLPVRQTLGLQKPSVRGWVAGALMPVCTLPMMILLMQVQLDAGWVDVEMMQRLEEFGADAVAPLAEPLGGALIWAVPGTMEELMLRGAVLGLLLPRGPWKRTWGRTAFALLAQAVAFGLLHMLAARWLPTGAMGLVLGILAVRTRSILPGMLAHMLHNLLAVQVLEALAPSFLEDPLVLGGLAVLGVPLLWLAAPPKAATAP